jgi:opacity protein-like surface antigen
LRFRNLVLNMAASAALIATSVHAQSSQPTASKLFEISTFGGLNGTYTGLSGGKNLGVTAGVDVGIRSFRGFRPSLEGRGTYPIDGGHIDAQRSALGGVRVERFLLPGLRVYGDFLAGRGQIDYQNGGYPSPGGEFLILRSTGNVISPGAGAEYRLTEHLTGLLDVQFQYWDSPASASGHIWSTPIMLGARYRFNFNRHGYPVAP